MASQSALDSRKKKPLLTFQSTLARSSQYRPDIDGLRAVAVLSVLFFTLRFQASLAVLSALTFFLSSPAT